MKIKRTSYVVKKWWKNPLWITTFSYNKGSTKLRPDMSLKSSEIQNYSWIIIAELTSPFCSSSCCQGGFPTIGRPRKSLWKLTLKIILNSPELNCSVYFSLYYLRVSKKMDYFLRNLVRRERRISWFNINPLSFIHRNDARWTISRFSPLHFAFAFDRAAKSFTFRCDACSSGTSSGLSVLLLFESITNWIDRWEILTQDWVLSSLRD